MARGGRVLWARWWPWGTGVEYQTRDGMGLQTHDGLPDSGGIPVMSWDTRHSWGTRQGWWGTRLGWWGTRQVVVYQM